MFAHHYLNITLHTKFYVFYGGGGGGISRILEIGLKSSGIREIRKKLSGNLGKNQPGFCDRPGPRNYEKQFRDPVFNKNHSGFLSLQSTPQGHRATVPHHIHIYTHYK